MYVWTALDADTKLVASFVVGKRSADNARRLMTDSASRLTWPRAGESDARNYKRPGCQPITQISTDMFAAYPEAVDLAFGPYVKFGTIRKDCRNATMPYTPSEMIGAPSAKASSG